jgi:hypothetical protein
MIAIKRGKNRNYLLMDGAKEVGEAWKMRGKTGFGVKLHGIYWRGDEPNTRGGSTTTGVRRLMDVHALVARTLTPNAEVRGGGAPTSDPQSGLSCIGAQQAGLICPWSV